MTEHPVPDRMRIHASLCAWRTVTTRTADLWTRAVADLASKHDINIASWGNDALISRARSVSMSYWLDQLTDADVLLWVDADISWRLHSKDYEGDLARICRSAYRTRGIVGGVYAKRMFGGGVAIRPDEPCQFKTGEDMLVKAHTVSTGFMAMHREGIDKIARTLPYVSDNNGPYHPFCLPYLTEYSAGLRFLSEDWALCCRAHDCGVPVHIDARPVLEHEGTHFYTVADGNRKVPT